MQSYDKKPEYMREVLDRIEARGEARGKAKGKAEGIIEGRLEEKKDAAQKLRRKGWSVEEIAEFVEIPVVDVNIWLGEE